MENKNEPKNYEFNATYILVSLKKCVPSLGVGAYSSDDVIKILAEYLYEKDKDSNFPYKEGEEGKSLFTENRNLFIENESLGRKLETVFCWAVLATVMFLAVSIMYVCKN